LARDAGNGGDRDNRIFKGVFPRAARFPRTVLARLDLFEGGKEGRIFSFGA